MILDSRTFEQVEEAVAEQDNMIAKLQVQGLSPARIANLLTAQLMEDMGCEDWEIEQYQDAYDRGFED